MAIDTGFLEANLIRNYPFIHNVEATIPDWLVVDFRAVVHDGEWDPTVHRVFLAWVARYGERLRFGFRTDAPGLAGQELVFERSLVEPARYQTTFVDSTPLTETLEDRCGCSVELLCDPDLDGSGPVCGPELLCNPLLNLGCGVELLCDPLNDPNAPDCGVIGDTLLGGAEICDP